MDNIKKNNNGNIIAFKNCCDGFEVRKIYDKKDWNEWECNNNGFSVYFDLFFGSHHRLGYKVWEVEILGEVHERSPVDFNAEKIRIIKELSNDDLREIFFSSDFKIQKVTPYVTWGVPTKYNIMINGEIYSDFTLSYFTDKNGKRELKSFPGDYIRFFLGIDKDGNGIDENSDGLEELLEKYLDDDGTDEKFYKSIKL